jgi:SAM-dependent methyltransferase
MESMFEGVSFWDQRVLDIGGGSGWASLYAAASGAREVVCLEPSAAGSSVKAGSPSHNAVVRLSSGRVEIVGQTLQEFAGRDQGSFGVVISNASINHLDETACERLMEPRARRTYEDLCRSIRAQMAGGARLILSDCCRCNLLESVGLRNPLRRTIEPSKHWDPSVWIEMFERNGFHCKGVRYLGLNSLRQFGATIMNNRVAAYLGSGDFRITFETDRHR